jgi:exosome complex component CSL4
VVRRSLRPAGPGLRPKRGAAAPSPRTARLQDVRATEVDRVVMYDCFRPGDVVRAEVVSLGDARSYHLSTARNELGVVHATSMAGNVMVPASWQEMRDPETQRVERRKVARVAGQQAAP